MVEAILWDNDGILVDTERLFFESTRRTLAKVGLELSLEQFLEVSMRQGRSAFTLAAAGGWAEQQIAELKPDNPLRPTSWLVGARWASESVRMLGPPPR